MACERFLKSGYANVNMDELSRDLGISKKTLYEYYDSKKALFNDCAKSIMTEHFEKVNEMQARMTRDGEFHVLDEMQNMWDLMSKQFKVFGSGFIDDVRRYSPESYKLCTANDETKSDSFKTMFKLGKEQGFIRENMNKNIFYLMFNSSLQSIMQTEVLAELSLNSKQALKMIFEILFQGVLTDFGNEEYNKVIKKIGVNPNQ
ncbi:MAG: TetR/AcrR family transcriptional regulator [Candidatus Kapaibacteriales bacterium]